MKELMVLAKNSLIENVNITEIFKKVSVISERDFKLGKVEFVIFDKGTFAKILPDGNIKEITDPDIIVRSVFDRGETAVKNYSNGKSRIYSPVFCKDRICGVMVFERNGTFSDEDVNNAEFISVITGIIMAHSEIREDIQKKLENLKVLYKVSRTLNETIDINSLLNKIVKLIRTTFGIDNVAVLLKESKGTLKIYAASEGYDQKIVKSLRINISEGKGITGSAAKNRKTVIANNVKSNPLYINGNKDTNSEMAVPIIHKGKLLGVLDLESNKLNRFTEEDRKVFETIAGEIAVAVENALLYKKVRELSEKDELTGLYNYRAFRKELDREVSRALRYKKKFSLAMFDVDYFKNYNDNNGHDVGNIALHTIGMILRKLSRKTDFPSRFGGEEFIVILPETDKKGAFVFAERIRKAIEKTKFKGEEKQPNGKLTVSGGVAEFGTDGRSAEEIIKSVDIAAYKAKEKGRNRIEIFEKE